jgi:hypothetical protein
MKTSNLFTLRQLMVGLRILHCGYSRFQSVAGKQTTETKAFLPLICKQALSLEDVKLISPTDIGTGTLNTRAIGETTSSGPKKNPPTKNCISHCLIFETDISISTRHRSHGRYQISNIASSAPPGQMRHKHGHSRKLVKLRSSHIF